MSDRIEEIRGRLGKRAEEGWELIGGGEYITPVGILVAPDDGGVSSDDAAFIANAPADVAFLLERVAEAEALIKDMAKQLVTLSMEKAEAWDEGRDAAHDELARMYQSQCEGTDCDCNKPSPNPYREEAT